MPKSLDGSDEKRIQTRYAVQWHADARLLTEQERIDIQAGNGLADLDTEALSLGRPRWGHERMATKDLSSSGLRLSLKNLEKVEAGQSLCLDLHLPGEQRVVKLLADVMWSGEQDGQPVAGLRFAALETEGLQRLVKLLRRANAS